MENTLPDLPFSFLGSIPGGYYNGTVWSISRSRFHRHHLQNYYNVGKINEVHPILTQNIVPVECFYK